MSNESILDTAYYMVFGRPHIMTIDENIRKWQKEIRCQMRLLDNQINKLKREHIGIERQIKTLSKKGEKSNTRTLVKELVKSRKYVEKLYKTKTQLNSVLTELNICLSNYKIAKSLKKSTIIMKTMNNLITINEINTVMKSMAYEMEKSGLIEEYIDNAIGINEDISEEVNEEVEKICDELLLNFQSKSPIVPPNKITLDNKKEPDEIRNDQHDNNLNEKISNLTIPDKY